MIKLDIKKKANNLVVILSSIYPKLKLIMQSDIIVLILASICSTFVLYSIFYLFAKNIWAMNLNVVPAELTATMRSAVVPGQRDGIEAYVLYLFAFANILGTFFIIKIYNLLNRNKKDGATMFLLYTLLTFLVISTALLITKVGLTPPMFKPAIWSHAFVVMVTSTLGTLCIVKIASWKNSLANIIIILLLIPVCFIATQPIFMSDYSYVFAPALRLINHVRISDIYMQYDLLLSLLAAVWMKLRLDLNYFQVLGQISTYVFFLAIFFFSKKYFTNKKLSYYLLAALVIMKVYGTMIDPIASIQTIPLRLDLWIIIIIIAYWKGLYSKILGATIGAVIILSRTFGLIYLVSYIEILAFLVMQESLRCKFASSSIIKAVKNQLSLSKVNLVIISVALFANLLIFGDIISRSAQDYSRIGIGFMPISKQSFYWFVFALIALSTILLIKKRKIVSEKYFITGLLLIFLAIGNSMYFFGRSHENNIINISASLLFVVFLLFDILSVRDTKDNFHTKTKCKHTIVAILPVLFIAMISYSYSSNIVERVKIQYDGILKSRYIYPIDFSFNSNEIKDVTNSSNRVYFVSSKDFYLYYYGGYKPQGYFLPYTTWIYKKEQSTFIQKLINDHYYISISKVDLPIEGEILSELSYNSTIETQNFVIISNNKH